MSQVRQTAFSAFIENLHGKQGVPVPSKQVLAQRPNSYPYFIWRSTHPLNRAMILSWWSRLSHHERLLLTHVPKWLK